MEYIIQKEDHLPAYLQLYQQVREDIVQGNYSYGSKLPSKRLIADETGISTVTVEHAYALLCDEGYIESRERSGYFVIFRTDDGFAATASQEILAVNPAYSGTSEEFPFSVLAKTMRGVLNEFGPLILTRPPNSGCLQLREAIRQYLARSRKMVCSVDQIVIGAGSEYLYSLMIELFGRDKIYAVESPSYKQINEIYRAYEVQYQMLPLGRDGIESRALWGTQASILHISPYRSFPSGVSASASKRHEYLRWAGEKGRYLVEDDFESEFSISRKPEETLFSHTKNDNVIYMNTFSKTISPSFRTGYMVIPKHLTGVFQEKLGFYSCTVPTFMQLVLAELITKGDFERHINRVRRKKRKEVKVN